MILRYLFSEPLFFLVWILGIIFALTVHEFAHAWVAGLMGDKTAKYLGRLTLNPLAHLDLFGFIFLLIAGFGWGKPVPVNPYNLKGGKWGSALVSFAGPGSNLLLTILAGVTVKLLLLYTALGPENLLITFLIILVQLNVILMVFNLLPIAPLDGSKIFYALLPQKFSAFKVRYERYGPMLLLGLIIFDSFLGLGIFAAIFQFVLGLVFRILS